MRRDFPIAVAMATLVASAATAQEPAPARSPYVGLEDRPIKALSEADVENLMAGEGMGYALAAELNGWPGPRHVLDLADSLALSADQRAAVEAIRARMSERARALGAALVDAEAELDRLFAAGDPEAATVEARTAAIARLEGRLRAAHLVAHLETRRALTERQVARYAELRGYGLETDDHEAEGHDHGAGHSREP